MLIYQLGYIAGIAGLVAAVCALKGYEKFGGRINAVGIVISLVIVTAVIYLAHNIAYAIEIKKAVEEVWGMNPSLTDAFRSIPDFLEEFRSRPSNRLHESRTAPEAIKPGATNYTEKPEKIGSF